MDQPDPRHIGQLLRDARDDFERRLNERRMFEPTPVEVGPAQHLILQHLDEDGTPVEVLLAKTRLPRAAFDAILEETMLPTKFLEIREEVLYYTSIGRSSFAGFRRTQAAIEEAYLNRLGQVRYAVLKEALADLAPRR